MQTSFCLDLHTQWLWRSFLSIKGLVCFCLLGVVLQGYGQGPAPVLHQKIFSYMQQQDIPGLAMGFVAEAGTGMFTFGEKNTPTGAPVEAETLFGLGEVSQVFTTALMVDMYYKEEIDLYRPLCEYVSPLIQVPQFMTVTCNYEALDELEQRSEFGGLPILGGISCVSEVDTPVMPITFCRLATHYSGLDALPSKQEKWLLTDKPIPEKYMTPVLSKEELLERFSQAELRARPGSQFRYAGWGMALIGHILAGQSTQEFGHLLKERLTDPLEMHDTFCAWEVDEAAQLATGHTSRGKPVPPTQWEGMAPAMGIYSTPRDMMRFLETVMGTNSHPLTAAIEECQVPHGRVGHKEMEDLRTGYGWWVLPQEQGKRYKIWAEGNTLGYSCYIGLIPEIKSGVFLMANKRGNLRKLGDELLDLLYIDFQQSFDGATLNGQP